jgi:hypothetical protein
MALPGDGLIQIRAIALLRAIMSADEQIKLAFSAICAKFAGLPPFLVSWL